MAMKASRFQNWMLTTHLYRFPASVKYSLFPQMINLALTLDAVSLCIFGKEPKGEEVISEPKMLDILVFKRFFGQQFSEQL